MPPKLVLFICLAFCALVYWRDLRRDINVSWALWVPTLWLMRCASRSLCYWVGGGEAGEFGEGCVYDRIFFVVLIVAGLYILSRRNIDWSEIRKNNVWLFIFFAYMCISCFWAEFPGISFKRWVRGTGDLIMVLVVLTEEEPTKAIGKLFRNCCILLIPLSVVFSKYFPEIGRGSAKHWLADSWIGVTTHKNTLGQLGLLAGIYFFWDIFREWPKKKSVINSLYLLMTIYLLNGGGISRSATSILLLVLGSVLLIVLTRWKSDLSHAWTFLIAIIVCGFFVQIFTEFISGSSIFQIIAESVGRSDTISGRSELWRDLIQLGMGHPLFGAGHMGFWTPSVKAFLYKSYIWGPGQAHNGYVEVFINLGLVGLLLLGLVVVSALRGAVKEASCRFELSRLRITLLVITLLHNYTEAGFTRPTHLMWFIFLLVAVNMGNGSLFRLNVPSRSE